MERLARMAQPWLLGRLVVVQQSWLGRKVLELCCLVELERYLVELAQSCMPGQVQTMVRELVRLRPSHRRQRGRRGR